jgi:glutamyl-tRNA reductase
MSDVKESQESIQEMIAKEFGFEDLENENQQKLIERMTESVIKRILVDAYEKLSESDRKTFEEMMENIENIDPDSVDEFLREKLTDYDAIISEAIEDLKKHLAETEE